MLCLKGLLLRLSVILLDQLSDFAHWALGNVHLRVSTCIGSHPSNGLQANSWLNCRLEWTCQLRFIQVRGSCSIYFYRHMHILPLLKSLQLRLIVWCSLSPIIRYRRFRSKHTWNYKHTSIGLSSCHMDLCILLISQFLGTLAIWVATHILQRCWYLYQSTKKFLRRCNYSKYVLWSYLSLLSRDARNLLGRDL